MTTKTADASMVQKPDTDRLLNLPSKRHSKPATMGVASNERD
jgi:hypothetical protein